MAIMASEATATINKVKAMQSRWGIGQTGLTVGAGSYLDDATINSIVDMVNQGKSVSGWGGGVSGKVSAGSAVTNVIASLGSQADAIRTHCQCNCNHCACNCNHCACNCNHCSCNCNHCVCNCNHCVCNCNDCERCSSDCDSSRTE